MASPKLIMDPQQPPTSWTPCSCSWGMLHSAADDGAHQFFGTSDLTGLVLRENQRETEQFWFFQCLPANMKPYQSQVFARAWVNSDLTQCWVHRQQCSTKHNTYVIEKSGPQFKLLKYPVSFLENCKNKWCCLVSNMYIYSDYNIYIYVCN